MPKYSHILASLIIPECISCRSYEVGSNDSRTFISNERTHEFLLLDGVSSDLWHMILNNASTKELGDFISENDLQDDIEDFINELTSADLLIKDNLNTTASASNPLPVPTHDTPEFVKMEEEMKDWAYDKGYLWSVLWEMTYKCNQRCVHCFNPDADKRNDKDYTYNNELTTDEAKKMIDRMIELGCFRLILSGGECLLRDDLFEIIEYARSKRLLVEIFSNGLVLNDEIINRLASLWIHKVGISIYSADKNLHDRVTNVVGSFDKSVYALRQLNGKGIKTVLKSIQLSITVDGYKETLKLGERLRSAVVLDLSLTPNMSDKNREKPLNYEIKDESGLIELFTDKDSPFYLGKIKNCGRREMNENILNITICGGGFNSISVDPYGNIRLCNSFPMVVGNLRNNTLKDIWKGEALTAWQSLKVKDFDKCFNQDYCKYCNPCPATSMLETGDYNSPSSLLCRQAQAKMKASEILRREVTLELSL